MVGVAVVVGGVVVELWTFWPYDDVGPLGV